MVLCASMREKVHTALFNVKFLADETWLNSETSEYVRKNQEIWRSFQQSNAGNILDLSLYRHRSSCRGPRTVRYVIPNSRLARYGNYPYDESREFFYTICEDNFKANNVDFLSAVNGEPWMLPQVNHYFNIYTRFIPRRLNQTLKPHDSRLKKSRSSGGINSYLPSQDCSIYMNPSFYSKNYLSSASTQLMNRYCHLPRFVTTVDQTVSHIRDYTASSFYQQNLEYYNEFILRGLIPAKSVQQLWLGDNQNYLISTLRTTTASDSFGHGCHFTHQNGKYLCQNTKRCQKPLYKHRPILNVNVSEFRPKLKPRGTTRSFVTQQGTQCYNQIQSILPCPVTNPLPLNVYSGANALQGQPIQYQQPAYFQKSNTNCNHLISTNNGPEKVAAALTKVKTWLKKVYPKRGRDLKKTKKISAHPFTFQFHNQKDESHKLHLKSKSDSNTNLVSDVEKYFVDLEREAIEQYQSSSEDLLTNPVTSSEEKFQELERQGLEQYHMSELEENRSSSKIVPTQHTSKSNLDSTVLSNTWSFSNLTSSISQKESHKVALLRKKKELKKASSGGDRLLEFVEGVSSNDSMGKLVVLHGQGASKERYIHRIHTSIVKRKHSKLGSTTTLSNGSSFRAISKTHQGGGDCGLCDLNFKG